MSLADVNVTLNIQSNVPYPVRINVLGNPYNPLDTSNAKTQYQYNLTAFTFTNETNVEIQYKASSSSAFSTFSQQLQSQNIQGVVNALNLLNIGSFQTYTQAGQTYISTYNDNFVFGQLNIFNPSVVTTALNYQFNYSGVGENTKILVNFANVFASGSPTNTSGNIPVVAGDFIEFQGTANNPLGTNIFILNQTTSTYIYNVTTNALLNFNQNFTILANNSYLIGMD